MGRLIDDLIHFEIKVQTDLHSIDSPKKSIKAISPSLQMPRSVNRQNAIMHEMYPHSRSQTRSMIFFPSSLNSRMRSPTLSSKKTQVVY